MRKSTVLSETLLTQDERETRRLGTLAGFDILDTLPEQGYEDVTELASFICQTPISLISFVDAERQWFKSERGLGARETPRDQSFCANTIATGEMLVVEDAEIDPRFRDNPLVTGDPKIRFYAGAPIIDGGRVLGTVCVIDRVPRTLTKEQLSALEALARQVRTLLHQRRGLMDAAHEASRLARTREVLRQSEARMALAADAAGIATWFYDPLRGVVGGDLKMGEWFGLSMAEGPAELWLAAVHPDDRERVGQEFAEGVQGKPYDTEYRVMRGGGVRWVRAKARLLTAGAEQRMVGICEEITDRKETEEALRTTAERLQLAQSAGRVATWEWDLADGTLLWGEESLWAYGRPPEEVSRIEVVLQFLHPDDVAHVLERVQPALEGTGEYKAEFRILWPDGSVHWTQAFGKPRLSAEGRPVAIVGFNIDISDRKLADEALIRTEKLAAVGRLASTMAHEINNPLEAVTNLLYLARHAASLEEAKPYLETADMELRRASAITNQALRFHKQATRPTSVTFGQLVQGILAGQHSRMANAHVHMEERDRARQPVLCFEGEIRQVLSNLVGNAIDAMQGKGGTLFLRGRDGHEWRTGRPGMVITVADSGAGMSAVTVTKLFDAFYTTKGISGTGLGLWISKEIMDRHVGRILVKSKPGVGSAFVLFLPYDAVTRQSEDG